MKNVLTLLFTIMVSATYAIEPSSNFANLADTTSTNNTTSPFFGGVNNMFEKLDNLAKDGTYTGFHRSTRKSSVILTGGARFSYMSGGLSETSTGYNVELLVEKERNKFRLRYGIGLNSSGGQNADMELVRQNIRVPIGVGIDLFDHNFLGHAQPVKFFITPYGQYAMSSNYSDQFKRWDVGAKASLALELSSFDLGVHYDMGFLNQSKIHNTNSYNRSFGIDLSWRFITISRTEIRYIK